MTDVIDTDAVNEESLKKEAISFDIDDHKIILMFHHDMKTNNWYCFMNDETFQDMKAFIIKQQEKKQDETQDES